MYNIVSCWRRDLGSKPILEESSSNAFVVSADGLVVSAHASSVRYKPAKCSDSFPTCTIHELEKRQYQHQ